MQELPIGVQSFEMLRRDGLLYVDKTLRLFELIENGRRYFLSRPRRFGKSLTLSTLDAMFSGKADLFVGLSAEKWVKAQSYSPLPVLRFDISARELGTPTLLHKSLKSMIARSAKRFDIEIFSDTLSDMFGELIEGLYNTRGAIVVLIDEYDKPILDNVANISQADAMRKVLKDFYATLKSYDDYLRFVFITGISKFSKVGVFSALNNLEDISMDEQFADIAGYTQQELEYFLGDRIKAASEKMKLTSEKLLELLREYYDGFCFDGKLKLYNPFSIMQCLKKGEFGNYWYESGSPSFIVEWMREHKIQEPDEYRHKVVKKDFVNSQEIERAEPSSFLFQSGYLTIEDRQEQLLTLDYPNREVMDSISSMYLELIYKVDGYALLGNEIWKALREGNISEVVRLYNIALHGIAYDDYIKNRNEFWYRSMFVMLLRGAGIIAYNEPHTSKGRADVVLQFQNLFVVLEFKFAEKSSKVGKKKFEGKRQIADREYSKNYDVEGHKVITAVLVIDDEKRQAML